MLTVGLPRSVQALTEFIRHAIVSAIEPLRIARADSIVAYVVDDRQTDSRAAVKKLLASQRSDGGWSDPEETAWATNLLSSHAELNAANEATGWLNAARSEGGGWGRHPRDRTRIITTALVIALVPEVATDADWGWLRQEWRRDLEREVKLSYKGGFYLLAEKKDADVALPDATIRLLENDQNDDGGFGPWKNHPIGSDPWSTGVVLWGLSRWIDRVDRSVIDKALTWLERTQLPSGYWPYHYLDEGTSYALIGAVSALKALQRM